MARDKCGQELAVGDTVVVELTITQIDGDLLSCQQGEEPFTRQQFKSEDVVKPTPPHLRASSSKDAPIGPQTFLDAQGPHGSGKISLER